MRLRYFKESKDLTNSMVMTIPLFVFYQIGILTTDGWRNGADFFTGRLIQLLGGNLIYYTIFNLAVLGAVIGYYFARRSAGTLRAKTWLGVIAESTLYAFIMGGIAIQILLALGVRPPGANSAALVEAAGAPTFGVWDSIVMSVGAGTYEELFFRVILFGGLLALFLRLKWRPFLAVLVASLVSSVIFSAFHYVPIGMDPWDLWSFLFRFILGVLLAYLYYYRGFAVAVYTHAIYDIFVLVPRALGVGMG